MEIYLIVIIVLIVLAMSDLVVGVSNDAVNFLNSAIGSKVAPRHIIMIVASGGILIGTTFSSGLMEVARKGIFNPDVFTFPEIMTIFPAVMFTDVLLLDLFNTYGLPTSTTVSLVFGLLGAAVGASIIKITSAGSNFADLVTYINTGKVLAIISGIMVSVAIAFSAGVILQFLTRLLFTFDYSQKLKRYGGLWGGIAFTAITFFILIKGAKGVSFLSAESSAWLIENTSIVILGSMIFWTIIIQLLLFFTKINILKPIVLVGTFALALAFAANDLVNFIGVPLAGLSSYSAALDNPDPLNMTMESLLGPVHTDTLYLLLAGAIMVATLYISKKAKTVTKTEINLGRQLEGYEKFESSIVARAIVRMNIVFFEGIKKATPSFIQAFIKKRFETAAETKSSKKDAPAFDLLRAANNLIISSMLISLGTSLKLPLSTTYVTFMVAMGTSLSDKAWGRESAVYRVNGVITVIGGWFFTAFMAFTCAAIIASLLYAGGIIALAIMVLLAVLIIFKTHILHKDRSTQEEEIESTYAAVASSSGEAIQNSISSYTKYFDQMLKTINNVFDGLFKGDREKLKKAKKDSQKVVKSSQLVITNVFSAIKLIDDEQLDKEYKYGKVVASTQELAANIRSLAKICYDHIDNHHHLPTKEQVDELALLRKHLVEQIDMTSKIISTMNFDDSEKLEKSFTEFQNAAKNFDKNQIKRIKKGQTSTRNTILLLSIFAETDNISDHIKDLYSAWRDNYRYLPKN